MEWVNEEIEYTIQRLADALREERDPVSRLGLTAQAREVFDRHVGRVAHDAVIALWKDVGYKRAEEVVGRNVLSRALATEQERDPTLRMKRGPRAKAHQPDPGTAVHFTPSAWGGT